MWSFQATLDRIGLSADPAVLRELIGPPLGESFRRLGVEESRIDDVVALYREFYAERGVYEAHLYDGVATTLDALVAQGVRVGVATAKRVDFARQMLSALGVAHLFDEIAGASVDLRVTAKYDIMATVLRGWTGYSARDVWMVGDRHFDMAAARRHEVCAVGALWGFGHAEELTTAGAHWLVARPRDLLDDDDDDVGGSPACLLGDVCDVCGAVVDGPHSPSSHARLGD